MKQQETNKSNTESNVFPDLKLLAEKEVREYTDNEIFYTDSPFPKNHLYCVRGKYCDFAELTNHVAVYLHPEKTTADTNVLRTQGEWNNNLHDGNVFCDGLIVAHCYSALISPQKIKANAAFIAKAVNNYDVLIDALKDAKNELKIRLHNEPTGNYDGLKLYKKICAAIASAEE